MNDRERIAAYLQRSGDADEFLLFSVAHVNTRGTFHRLKMQDEVANYRATGRVPAFVSQYLNSLN